MDPIDWHRTHVHGYVKNTFQFTLSPSDWGSIKKTSSPDGPNTKMRGCCGRELDRAHILDGNLDGGSNSSSVISVQKERAVRPSPVAAHARVMILWPFYN
ncbi:uncharacterized protein Dsimw501_GD27783 [Drosophila simulans]|uniref:Uncharacterized protein n=1 Tax=Drosophila simulans TaxID=7240 RepID=A0A0J9UIQ8_DROSI|nr:uncharacterized protein Dsimw501_GD27783 [Drosophila simulans]